MHQGTPKLWNRGYARAALMGKEPTMNPTPAAAMLLGMTPLQPRQHRAGHASRSILKKRHPRTANPVPAAIAIAASVAKKLGINTGSPRYEGGPLMSTVQDFLDRVKRDDKAAVDQLHTLATSPGEKHRTQWAKVWNVELPALGGSISSKMRAYIRELDPTSQLPSAGERQLAAPGVAQQALNILGQPGTIRTIASAARPARRSPRARYPTYVDRYGRQRYSTRPPEAGEMRLPAGATPAPGTPYSFFRGAVGKGGVGATAGQLALAAGAGLAAYLVTQKLLQHLGGGALRKEEAGVQAGMALKEALDEYKRQKGAYPPPAERAQMKEVYRAKLVELGYNPDTFQRTRSGVENFLSTYNPLD